MKKYHRNHEDFRDVFLGVRITERQSDLLNDAAPINKSQWVRDAIETKLKVEWVSRKLKETTEGEERRQ